MKDFNKVHTFPGVGFASMVILNFLSVYYIVILAWSLFYMFHSFTSHLAWSDCTNPWNTPACYDGRAHGLSGNLSLLNSSAAGAYGAMNVTNVTQALEHKSPILEFWELVSRNYRVFRTKEKKGGGGGRGFVNVFQMIFVLIHGLYL